MITFDACSIRSLLIVDVPIVRAEPRSAGCIGEPGKGVILESGMKANRKFGRDARNPGWESFPVGHGELGY